jgi:hypothetical protein
MNRYPYLDQLYPETNQCAAKLLYGIEVCLREFIIDKLKHDSPKWRKALPPDIREKMKEGEVNEKACRWTTHVLLHPIYYLDFADLPKLFSRKDYMRFFDTFFGRTDVIANKLNELLPIRNKLAHNRKITDSDIAIIESCFASLESTIGEVEVRSYIEKCSHAPDLVEQFNKLKKEIIFTLEILDTLASPLETPTWDKCRDQWWLEDDLDQVEREYSTQAITEYFTVYTAYTKLTRGRGTGVQLERWQTTNDYRTLGQKAITILEQLLDGKDNE